MEKCGHTMALKTISGEILPERTCSLPKGHEGHHRDAEGAVWLNTASLPYIAPLVPRDD